MSGDRGAEEPGIVMLCYDCFLVLGVFYFNDDNLYMDI